MKTISAHAIIAAGTLFVVASAPTLAFAAARHHAGPVTVTSHFVVTNDPETSGDSAYLYNGAAGDDPKAIVFATLNQTPGGVCGCAAVTKPLGVWYDASVGDWAVFNEDGTNMPSDPSFNILIVQKPSASAFVQRATPANTVGGATLMNSKLLNGNARAIIQVTPVWNPGGTSTGVLDPNAVGVRYYGAKKKWGIFNEDGAAIATGAAFNVMVGATASNGGTVAQAAVRSTNGVAFLNNPISNGNPNNVTFATQVFNPGGKAGIANPHAVQVGYPPVGVSGVKEYVFNADVTTAPVGAAFNLLIFNS